MTGAANAKPAAHERRAIGHSLDALDTGVEDVSAESALNQLRRFNDLVLRLAPVGVGVIDRDYRIVTISGAARRLLGIREIGVDTDFLHAVRGRPYARVRTAIDTVFREKTATTLSELEMDPASAGDGRYLLLTVVPMQIETGWPELAVLSVTDVTEQVQSRRRLEAAQADQAQLVDELGGANKRLSDLNKELQDANEELQASNEEFEATNEEMQATNDELEATNDELSARTQELIQLTRSLEGEQARLERVVEMAPFAVVLLKGERLEIESTNAMSKALFDGGELKGRVFGDVLRVPERAEAVASCLGAFRTGEALTTAPMTIPVHDEAPAQRVVFRVVPLYDSFGGIDGLALYLENSAES